MNIEANTEPTKLVIFNRDGLIEREHFGYVVRCDEQRVLEKIGEDKRYPFFMRSCAKPLQASLIIDYELDKKFNLTEEEIASYFLMCISEKYLEQPENSKILSVANYLSGRYKIGEYLVSTKVISEKQLEKAIEVDLNSKNNRKFGQILIDLGFIKEESLKAIILLKDEAKKRFILD